MIIVGVVVAVAAVAYPLAGATEVPHSVLGTWKVNVAKSTYNPGPAPRVTTTNRIEMATDGKTRTQVTTGTGADGRPVHNVTVWDRQ